MVLSQENIRAQGAGSNLNIVGGINLNADNGQSINLLSPSGIIDIRSGSNIGVSAANISLFAASNITVSATNRIQLVASQIFIEVADSGFNASAILIQTRDGGGAVTGGIKMLTGATTGTAVSSGGITIQTGNIDSESEAAPGNINIIAGGNLGGDSGGQINIVGSLQEGSNTVGTNINIQKASHINISSVNTMNIRSSAITMRGDIIGVPMKLTGFNIGVVATSTIYGMESISTPMTIPTQSALSAFAIIPDDDGVSFNIKHGGGGSAFSTASVVGTIGFASAATAGSVRFDACVTLAVGDFIAVQASVVAGSATVLTDFTWSILARSGS
jgi:hypothetical protein